MRVSVERAGNATELNINGSDSKSARSHAMEEPNTDEVCRTTRSEDSRRGWPLGSLVTMVFCLAVVLLISTYSVLTVVGTSALDPPLYGEFRKYVNPVFPQGWAFFTRSPREAEYFLVSLNGQQPIDWNTTGGTGRLQSIFGADRSPGLYGYDSSAVLEVLEEDHWTECGGPVTDACLRAAMQAPKFKVSVSSAFVECGKLAIVRREPYAWAYANKGFDPEDAHVAIQIGELICDA